MWLTPYKDPTLAELFAQSGGIHGGGSIPASLLHRDNWADVIKQVAPVIKDYIQKKKSDEIANQLMNMEQPPRAQAVDQYGATYDPALAARQGLNSATDPSATTPFTGGADQFKVRNMYQAYLDKQQQDQVKAAQDEQTRRLKEAQITDHNSGDAPHTGPSYVDTPYGRMTAQQWAEYQRKQVKAEGGLPRGVSQSMYENSKTQNFNPAQAFRDMQQAQGNLPAPDLPPIGPSEIPNIPAQKDTLKAAGDANAQAIRDAYHNGTMSKEEAVKRLRALGFE